MTKNTTPTNEAGHGLPELPEPYKKGRKEIPGAGKFDIDCGAGPDLYTAKQVQQYARDYAAALALSRGVPAERMAPVQGYTPGIPWSMHLEAYDVYCKRYGKQPALIDLERRNCRGGFGTNELDMFIPGWRERLSEFNAMKARIAELEAMQAAPAAAGAQGEGVAEKPCKVCGTPEYAWANQEDATCLSCHADATPQPAAADGGVRGRHSTHHVHRGPESLPCYCAATEDHQIGEESRKGEALARRFHEIYERLAPSFGYETRTETRAFDPMTPNGRLMIAVCERIETALSSHRQAGGDQFRELAERWREEAELANRNTEGNSYNVCADELLALVEKGAGNG